MVDSRLLNVLSLIQREMERTRKATEEQTAQIEAVALRLGDICEEMHKLRLLMEGGKT